MKVLIVDDEFRAREAVRQMLLLSFGNSLELSEAEGVKQALESIRNERPMLLLLDIRLQDGSGFELLEKIKHEKIPVIFITAYNEFAIKAFKYAALDYLLKPVDLDELTKAVREAIEKYNREDFNSKLGLLMEKLSKPDAARRITLKTTEFIYVVPIDSIIFCEADGAYTRFYLTDFRKIMVSKSIGEYEALINDPDFIRTHQSYLVNMKHVTCFDKGLSPSLITLHEHVIPVSTRRKDQVISYLNSL